MEKTKRVRKTYTEEFKVEALARCETVGQKKASEELGVHPSVLQRWKREKSGGGPVRDKSWPSYGELEQEVRRLKKELDYVEEINRVLKKSTAIFSSKEMGGFR